LPLFTLHFANLALNRCSNRLDFTQTFIDLIKDTPEPRAELFAVLERISVTFQILDRSPKAIRPTPQKTNIAFHRFNLQKRLSNFQFNPQQCRVFGVDGTAVVDLPPMLACTIQACLKSLSKRFGSPDPRVARQPNKDRIKILWEWVVKYFEPIPSTRLDAIINRIVIENALCHSAHRVWITIEPPGRYQQIKLIHWPALRVRQ
jgi:hypothetical protein